MTRLTRGGFTIPVIPAGIPNVDVVDPDVVVAITDDCDDGGRTSVFPPSDDGLGLVPTVPFSLLEGVVLP